MSNELLHIFLLSLFAMFNPSLLAALTVMLLLPSPKRLMIGYLLGVHDEHHTRYRNRLHASQFWRTSTAKHTISPIEDLVVGCWCC